MRTQYVLLGLLAVVAAVVVVTTPTYAQTTTPTPIKNDFLSSFASFFSSKFGLDKTQVQSAIKEFRETKKGQMEEHMKERMNSRLDALVKNGKITQAQKQAILTKLAALHDKYNMENMKDLTPEQRKEKMNEQKKEIEAWATSQNIDVKYLLPGNGMGMKMRKFDKWGGSVGE